LRVAVVEAGQILRPTLAAAAVVVRVDMFRPLQLQVSVQHIL
jgi:hypothetical protein